MKIMKKETNIFLKTVLESLSTKLQYSLKYKHNIIGCVNDYRELLILLYKYSITFYNIENDNFKPETLADELKKMREYNIYYLD